MHVRRAAALALAAVVGLGAFGEACARQPASPAPQVESSHRVHSATGSHGLAVSDSRPASEAGREILEAGGNAVDAAVATALALAVSWPEAGNLGGGGFMLVKPPNQPAVCVDYRETAPEVASPRMFAPNENRHTHRVVGVPGTVRGLALAHRKFGKLNWARVVAPAIRLAAEGVTVDRHLARSLNGVLGDQSVATMVRFEELRRVFGHPAHRPWRAGDTLRQPDLARTLQLIAEKGPDAFYAGRIARQIVTEMRRGGGLLTDNDLRKYEAKVRQPIRGTFGDYTLLGPPPPSSGGICTVQIMNMLEPFKLREQPRYSSRTLHLLTEAMRRAFRDRAAFLGDPDFVAIPTRLTTKEHARQIASNIDSDRATPSIKLAGDIAVAPDRPNTTHFSVIDGEGMAVSNTYTLEASWGARIVVRGAGFVLNNEMGDFNWVPGLTDRKGRIGTKPNLIQPGKRMLSSQNPTIVLRDGRVHLIVGSPGGRTIINTVVCILVNVLEYGMPLDQAVALPRQHHQWFPDRLYFEGADEPAHRIAVEELRAMGHDVVRRAPQGSAHAILADKENGTFVGVADWRRGGYAAAARPDP